MVSLATAIYSRTRDREAELTFVYGYILPNWLLDRNIVVRRPYTLLGGIHAAKGQNRAYTYL
jgi:hypothetical protein